MSEQIKETVEKLAQEWEEIAILADETKRRSEGDAWRDTAQAYYLHGEEILKQLYAEMKARYGKVPNALRSAASVLRTASKLKVQYIDPETGEVYGKTAVQKAIKEAKEDVDPEVKAENMLNTLHAYCSKNGIDFFSMVEEYRRKLHKEAA